MGTGRGAVGTATGPSDEPADVGVAIEAAIGLLSGRVSAAVKPTPGARFVSSRALFHSFSGERSGSLAGSEGGVPSGG